MCQCPLIGDSEYGGDKDFKDNGLFLCSNQVKLRHPYYNTVEGQKEWENMNNENDNESLHTTSENDFVHVHASIDLPTKFKSFLKREEERYNKFNNSPSTTTTPQ